MNEAPANTKPAFSPKAASIFGWVLLALGLPMLIWGVWYLGEAIASASWPTVEGRVTHVGVYREARNTTTSSTRTRSVSYRYSVKYAYDVNGKSYESDKYAMGSGNTAGRAPTHREAREEGRERFPIGKRVSVSYDPDDPSMAVLRPGASSDNWGTYVPIILGLFFAALGAWLVLYARKRRGRGVESGDVE